MYSKALVATLISAMLLLSIVPTITFAGQPPLDTTTMILGTIGMPYRADGATAYDTGSGALIMNVYEPLIWFDVNYTELDPRDQGSIGDFVPRLATAMPTKEVVILDLTNITC